MYPRVSGLNDSCNAARSEYRGVHVKRSIRLTLTAVTTAAVVLVGTQAKAIDAPPVTVDQLATHVARVGHHLGALVSPTMGTTDLTAHLQAGASVTIPRNTKGLVGIKNGDSPTISLSLPAEADTKEPVISRDGTVVYKAAHADGVSVAVQALEQGAVSIQTVLESAASPRSFTYTVQGGVQPKIRADGGADLVVKTGEALLVVGEVKAPWAVDANGNAVDTKYVVSGSKLTQLVNADANTAYPVVADPTYGSTWGIPTVYLDRSETNAAASDIQFVYIICSAAGLWNPVVGVVCAGNAFIINKGAKNAVARNECVKIMIGPGVVGTDSFSDNCH